MNINSIQVSEWIILSFLTIVIKEILKSVGFVVLKFFKSKHNALDNPGISSSLGLFFIVYLLKISNYILSLEEVSIILGFITILLFLFKITYIKNLIKNLFKPFNLLQLFICFSILFKGSSYSVDSFYYGYQIILWKLNNPITLGLGNFFPWLLTSSFIFDLAGLIGNIVSVSKAASVINVLILLITLEVYSSEIQRNRFLTEKKNNYESFYALISIFFIFAYGFSAPGYLLLSPNPDFPNFLVVNLCIFYFLKFLSTEDRLYLAITIICSILAFASRSHSVVIMILLSIFSFVFLNSSKLTRLKFSLLPSIPIMICMLDNFVMSSYPFFPSGVIGIPTSWIMNEASLNNYVFGLRNWTALQPCTYEVLNNSSYSKIICVFYQTISFKYLFLLFLIGLIINRDIFSFRNKNRQEHHVSIFFITFSLLLTILFLIVYSPQLRFIYTYMIATIILTATIQLVKFKMSLKILRYLSHQKINLIQLIIVSFVLLQKLLFMNQAVIIDSADKIESSSYGSNYKYYVSSSCGFNLFPCTGLEQKNLQVERDFRGNIVFNRM